ncbi:MAG TPA: acyltransferase [Terracidiphilus sp.]|nr:acyltransferase [Terracidiphilus sp.]
MLSAIPVSPSKSPARYDARSNYSSLNGLRCLAALAVVAFHFMPVTKGTKLDALVACGPAAVGFFFLLSGFVLAHRHPSTPNKADFYWARFVRIYPMYLLAFLLFLPLAIQKYHATPHLLPVAAALNLFMVQSWTPLSQSWNGPSWSLSVEAFLYLTFPFLVGPIGRANHRVLWIFAAMIPAACTIPFCLGVIPAHLWRSWIGNNPAFFVPVFGLGISLGLWRSSSSDTRKPMDAPIIVVLGAIVLAAILWPAQLREVFINGGAVALFAAAVVLCTYRTIFMAKILGNTIMDRLGKASYITYIVQAPLWHYFHAAVNRAQHRELADSRTSLPEFLAFVVFLLLCSVFLDVVVDEPIRKRLNRLWKARTASSRPLTPTLP